MALVKTAVKAAGTAIQTGAEKVLRNLPVEQADFITKTFNFKPGSPQDTFVRMGGIHPTDGPGIINSIQRGEAQDLPQHITNAVGGEQGALNEIARFSDNGTNQATEDTIKANNLSNAQPKSAEPANIYPARYDVAGDQAGFDTVHANLSKWLKEQQAAKGNIKDIDRSAFAPEGIFIGGEERTISGVTQHLEKGKRLKLNKLGAVEARLKQMDPDNVPGLREHADMANQEFIESGGKQGVHPDLKFDDFKAHIRKGAREADELTAAYAKKFGLDLDKEHMAAIGNKATDDARSQFPGSASYNRRMGKLDSFTKEVMEILGLPGAGDAAKAASIKGEGPRSTARRQQYEQSGWWKAYTDWAATDGASLDDMSKWNPGDILTDSDKLKIQRAFGKNQADVAQQILAERQIAEAARRAGLLDEPDEIALVKKLLKRIDIDEKILKAKRSTPEGQLDELRLKFPNLKKEDLLKKAEQTLEYRTSMSKRGMNEPRVTKIKKGK